MMMTCGLLSMLLLAALCERGFAIRQAEPPARFETVSVFVETGEAPLAAWQLDISATAGTVRIVGIEGGDHPAYSEPPYYDPLAMQQDRVIIAAFSLNGPEALPSGRTRVATIHVQIPGDVEPEFEAKIDAAADHDGEFIDAEVVLQIGTDK
ncbi:MAG: hypothetical protein JSV91_07650 [Phycisphaerales bacterium]|nr:MAG: hypothetical protein JSV91_07650 [Phycisphaerales bacterium]